MRLHIVGGRVIDPASNTDAEMTVVIDNDRIEALVPANEKITTEVGFRTINANGCWVVPGLIDMHVHLREPGQEYKEDIYSGSLAANAGGFTSVVCMPNTKPVNDRAQITEFMCRRAEEYGLINLYPTGAISVGLKGEQLAPIGELVAAGCVAITDDGQCVQNANLKRRALEYAKNFDIPVLVHCEDTNLSRHAAMHEGFFSTKLGMQAQPAAAEDVMTARDIILCQMTGSRLHISHLSTKLGVELVRRAKADGVKVTAEGTPHHFTLTDEAVCGFDTNTKMYPPLRSAADREAVKQGLADGTLDAIATDHAPHSSIEKDVEYGRAAFGILGLQTAVPLTLRLVREGVLTPMQAIAKLTTGPASVLRLKEGRLSLGAEGSVALIDPQASYTLNESDLLSKSKNSPFVGWELTGRVDATIFRGRVVFQHPDCKRIS